MTSQNRFQRGQPRRPLFVHHGEITVNRTEGLSLGKIAKETKGLLLNFHYQNSAWPANPQKQDKFLQEEQSSALVGTKAFEQIADRALFRAPSLDHLLSWGRTRKISFPPLLLNGLMGLPP